MAKPQTTPATTPIPDTPAGSPPAQRMGLAPAGIGTVPDFMDEFSDADAGAGVSTDQADNLVPLIYVFDPKSPQVNRHKPESYVKGSEPGDIWLKGAPEGVAVIKGGLDNEGLLFQPCYYARCVNEWIPKNADGSGGGFVARHNVTEARLIPGAQEVELPAEKPGDPPRKKWMNADRSHEFVETREHAGFAITEMGALPYILSFKSTGHQTSRAWMPLMNQKKLPNGKKPPSWAALYRVQSYSFTRGSQSWFKLQVTDAGPRGTPLWVDLEGYQRGRALYEAFASGAKEAAAPEHIEPEETGGGDGQQDGDWDKKDALGGDKIPF